MSIDSVRDEMMRTDNVRDEMMSTDNVHDKLIVKERRFYTLLSFILFIPGAFSFWEFVYEMCNMIGSIASGDPAQALAELKRMLPLILTAFIYVYLAVKAFRAYTALPKQRACIWRQTGLTSVIAGAVVCLYVIIGLITGQYARIIEGHISLLFPLDMVIGGVVFILYGVHAVRYSGRLGYRLEQEQTASAAPTVSTDRPYPSGPICITSRFRFFHILSYLAAMCGFAACFYGTYVLDFAHGSIFFNIMLLLNYFSAFAMLIVYRFIYVEQPAGAHPVVEPSADKHQAAGHLLNDCPTGEYSDVRKPSLAFKWSLGFLIGNIIIFILYLVSVELQNEAPNLNAFGLLPIEFTASFNAFPVIYGLNNIIAPLTALIKSRSRRPMH